MAGDREDDSRTGGRVVRFVLGLAFVLAAPGTLRADDPPAGTTASPAASDSPVAQASPDEPGSASATADAGPADAGAKPSAADELRSGRVAKLIERFTYTAIIVVLLLCGMGLPLPEEVPIIVSAILAAAGHLRPWPALGALMFGVMLGDSVMFLLGKRWGDGVLDHRFARRMLSPERRLKIAGYFNRYGAWIIFAARFLPGLRAPLFLTSGTMGVSFWTFFAMDGAAALLSIPASFWLAWYFADRIDEFLDLSHKAQHWTIGLIVAAVALSLGLHFAFSKIKAKRAQAAAAAQGSDPTTASAPAATPANQSAPAPGSETPVA